MGARNRLRNAWRALRGLPPPRARPQPLPQIEYPLPTRTLELLLPGSELTEVAFLPRLIRRHRWAMPEHEVLVLGALCRQLVPARIVEFGTFTGGSTLAMAANTPPATRILTVDVAPHTQATHVHGLGVGFPSFDTGVLFRDTPFAAKIEQRFVDTRAFEVGELAEAVDLVFVDADHTYEFVRRDSETAYAMLRPGGAIVWHDYRWEPQDAACVGVTQAVNEFWQKHGDCFQIAETRFAIHLPRHV